VLLILFIALRRYHTRHATQTDGVGRGGRRPGAGRPRGRRDKRTVLMELLPELEETDQQMPLYRLLARIADESEDIRYRDALSIACLPYLHSRLVSNMVVKPAYLMSDDELQQVRAAEIQHEKEIAPRARPSPFGQAEMTLSPTERAALRQQWLAEIDAEIERRQAAALEVAGGDPREQLLAVLEQMGQTDAGCPRLDQTLGGRKGAALTASRQMVCRERLLRPLSLRCHDRCDRCPSFASSVP
jgi:hypothetical protein